MSRADDEEAQSEADNMADLSRSSSVAARRLKHRMEHPPRCTGTIPLSAQPRRKGGYDAKETAGRVGEMIIGMDSRV
jgi:hypothetical protein